MEKTLTVSIAAYNIEDYIEKTVESIANSAAIDDIEIIIVNDGSKDSTRKKAFELKERFPECVVVIDKENGGYGSTINESIKIAAGKYYKLLDGDDWYKTDNIKEFIDYLKNTDADVVISPYYRVSDIEELYDNHQEISNKAMRLEDIHIDNPGVVMHELSVKTEIFRNLHKIITENCFYTDVEFTCNSFIAANTIARFDKPVYCYRIDVEGQSVSLSGLRKHYKDHPKVIDKVFSSYIEYEETIYGNKKRIIDYWIENLIRNAFVSYLVLEDAINYRNELLRLDVKIKNNYPMLYDIGNKSKLVKTLRQCHFRPYRLWSKYVVKTFS